MPSILDSILPTKTFAKKFHAALIASEPFLPIPDELMRELAQHLRPSEIHILLDALQGIDDSIDSRVGPRNGQTSYMNLRD